MKIKVFIVTYKSELDLQNNVVSLLDSDIVKYNYDIYIINNHSEFKLDIKSDKINILHNNVRPDFSTGHLSRNWNQAIINGFKDINNPDCDILITCQDDVVWLKNAMEFIIDSHNKYSFLEFMGDCMCSYKVDSIKKVGLWDERFCGLGWHEADYLLRNVIYNTDYCSINDTCHGRIFNELDGNYYISRNNEFGNRNCIKIPPRNNEKQKEHDRSISHHEYCLEFFKEKWGNDIKGINWNSDDINNYKYGGIKEKIKYYKYYPYFEV